jgi:hypothetical protein
MDPRRLSSWEIFGPGFYSSTLVEFPDTVQFSSALFSATLNSTDLVLDDGSGFVAASDQITALLLPASGNSLVAGTDLQLIEVSSVSSVPEPGSLVLIFPLLLVWCCRRPWQRNP